MKDKIPDHFPTMDETFASIVGNSIQLNEKRIQKKIKSFNHLSNRDFLAKMNEEVCELFYERKKILQYIFKELKSLPKTKNILLENNLIIELLQLEIAQRMDWSATKAKNLIHPITNKYLNLLQERILEFPLDKNPEFLEIKQQLSDYLQNSFLKSDEK